MPSPEPDEMLVLWNNQASGASAARGLRDEIAARPGVSVVEASTAEESQAQARAAAERGTPVVVAAGGDGSIHNVLQGLAGVETPTRLGVLPLGTGNDLCRNLHLPLEPRDAWQAIIANRGESIDLVRVTTEQGSRWYSNCANGGNSTRLLERIDSQLKRDWGKWAYLRAALEIITDMHNFRMHLTLDDNPQEEHLAWNVVLANGSTTGGGVPLAPRASLTDGLLEVIVILDSTPFEVAELAADLLAGDFLEHPCVVYRRARRVRLTSEPAIDVVVDGEYMPGHQHTFEVFPKALKVIVGPEFAAG